ncbi:MAG: HNH endonuclease [Deltaproteobacteria bacterium]|nr:HNH endonuclease [Deltaproteobacteria bacterium]
MYRDHHTYQCCRGKSKDKKLQVHHIVFCSEKEKDTPNNLITICPTCHNKSHDGTIKPSWKCQKYNILRYDTQLNVVVKRLSDYLNTIGLLVNTTFGFITKINRLSHNLDKTHYNDAIMIAL